MNTRRVEGFALPATAHAVFEHGDQRYLVLNDGRMMRFDGADAPDIVLGLGPRPMGIMGDVVLTSDGSTARLGDLSPRVENVDGTGVVKAIPVEGALVVLDERGVVQRWTPEVQQDVVTGVQSLHDANEASVLVTQSVALSVHALDGSGDVDTPHAGSHGERITAGALIEGGGVLVAREGMP